MQRFKCALHLFEFKFNFWKFCIKFVQICFVSRHFVSSGWGEASRLPTQPIRPPSHQPLAGWGPDKNKDLIAMIIDFWWKTLQVFSSPYQINFCITDYFPFEGPTPPAATATNLDSASAAAEAHEPKFSFLRCSDQRDGSGSPRSLNVNIPLNAGDKRMDVEALANQGMVKQDPVINDRSNFMYLGIGSELEASDVNPPEIAAAPVPPAASGLVAALAQAVQRTSNDAGVGEGGAILFYTFFVLKFKLQFFFEPQTLLRAMPRSGIGFADLPESMLLSCFSIFCFDKWFWPALPRISLPRRICKKSSRLPSRYSNATDAPRRWQALSFANKFLTNYVLTLFYRALNAKRRSFQSAVRRRGSSKIESSAAACLQKSWKTSHSQEDGSDFSPSSSMIGPATWRCSAIRRPWARWGPCWAGSFIDIIIIIISSKKESAMQQNEWKNFWVPS